MLYKNGVGYFEHSARVHGNQDLAIDFTTSQLNDVLKSLTAVDLGDGHISGVRYNSIAPLDERLKALRLPFGEQITQVDFLAALRGARVEVRNGSDTATGRLLSVEKEKRFTDKGESYEVTAFSVISDTGDLRSFDLGSSTSVRLVEHDLNDEVGKYLNLIGSSRARDLRRMTISATGTGDREIFVSYISEVPVWKSTYRIILPDKPNDKPLLQGWAIVDNTVGEDWRDVQLSLIAGAPQSFIQDISRPLYTRRPVVPLPQAAMLTPQTQEASMSAPAPAVAQTFDANAETSLTVDGQATAIHGGGVGGGMLRAQASNGNLKQWVAQSPFDAVAKQQAEAEAKDLGDYFEYNLKQKITIGKNQSALVPILQSPIGAEKVTIWNENSREIRRALWITNSSGLTLDSGTFNILESDTFAGEGLIETVHPAERRLISYAADPGSASHHGAGVERKTHHPHPHCQRPDVSNSRAKRQSQIYLAQCRRVPSRSGHRASRAGKLEIVRRPEARGNLCFVSPLSRGRSSRTDSESPDRGISSREQRICFDQSRRKTDRIDYSAKADHARHARRIPPRP